MSSIIVRPKTPLALARPTSRLATPSRSTRIGRTKEKEGTPARQKVNKAIAKKKIPNLNLTMPGREIQTARPLPPPPSKFVVVEPVGATFYIIIFEEGNPVEGYIRTGAELLKEWYQATTYNVPGIFTRFEGERPKIILANTGTSEGGYFWGLWKNRHKQTMVKINSRYISYKTARTILLENLKKIGNYKGNIAQYINEHMAKRK